MDHLWANEFPCRRNYATLFRAIHATVTSLFFKRIIVFAVGRPGTAGAKKANFAEYEQICPWSDGKRAGDFDWEGSEAGFVAKFSLYRAKRCLAG